MDFAQTTKSQKMRNQTFSNTNFYDVDPHHIFVLKHAGNNVLARLTRRSDNILILEWNLQQ
jgi:hypothetical protein